MTKVCKGDLDGFHYLQDSFAISSYDPVHLRSVQISVAW